MKSHDPSEYIRGLMQLLISDKKRIAFLFGAGTSVAKKQNNSQSLNIPSIGTMTTLIEEEIVKEDIIKKAIDEIKNEIHPDKYNIETLLSNLERKIEIIGNGKLNGLNKKKLEKLIKKVKTLIRNEVSVHNKNGFILTDLIHVDFAKWIGKFDRKYPIEIFTTNYDYLFELGLEYHSIPYYDGFTGSYKPFFNPESVENLTFLPNQTKLWKIHGSLGWHYDVESKKIWRKDSDNDDILIYPSTLKYDNSKKQPYTALGDRLTNFLKQSDTVLITCGYSFGDEHINERILTALKSNSSAHVYVLNYDITYNIHKEKVYSFNEHSHLYKMAEQNSKISVFGNRNALIGCQYGTWKLKKEPDKEDAIRINTYFVEDNPNTYKESEHGEICDKKWTGEGELIITDFAKFVRFIQSLMTSTNNENK